MKSIVEKARKIVTQLYERNMVSWNDLDREVVFAIQALNAEVQRMEALAQPEQEQEPFEDLAPELFVVAQTSPADDGFSDTIDRIEKWLREHFSTPPQRKLLTDEEIKLIHFDLCNTVGSDYKTIARAIEAAHGIKE
jgi:hypothetical protein